MTNAVYKPKPMRTQEAIRADILALEQETEGRLTETLADGFVSHDHTRRGAQFPLSAVRAPSDELVPRIGRPERIRQDDVPGRHRAPG